MVLHIHYENRSRRKGHIVKITLGFVQDFWFILEGLASNSRSSFISLLLLTLFTLTTDSCLVTEASNRHSFPIGVLSSKGNLHLNGLVHWGQHEQSMLPMIYEGTIIKLKDGTATLELLMGGTIKFCDVTDLTVQQMRSPYLFTLQRGTIDFNIPESRGDVFFTPDFLIKIDPTKQLGATSSKGKIRLEPDGTICVKSHQGTLTVSTQDYSETVSVPEGEAVSIQPGQIVSLQEIQDCSCNAPSPLLGRPEITSAAHQTGGSSFAEKSTSFLRKLIKILTLGLI